MRYFAITTYVDTRTSFIWNNFYSKELSHGLRGLFIYQILLSLNCKSKEVSIDLWTRRPHFPWPGRDYPVDGCPVTSRLRLGQRLVAGEANPGRPPESGFYASTMGTYSLCACVLDRAKCPIGVLEYWWLASIFGGHKTDALNSRDGQHVPHTGNHRGFQVIFVYPAGYYRHFEDFIATWLGKNLCGKCYCTRYAVISQFPSGLRGHARFRTCGIRLYCRRFTFERVAELVRTYYYIMAYLHLGNLMLFPDLAYYAL